MFSSTLWTVVLTSSLACIIITLGIKIISRYEKWGIDNAVYFMSFAAGVLIAVSFIHIIPRSFTMSATGPIYLLAGFLAFYLFNRFLNAYVCHEYECPDLSLGIIPMLGVGLHSFLDGVIYSVTFNVSIFTGTPAAIGMVLHEFPEGIVTFLLLERGGFNKKKSAGYAFLASIDRLDIGLIALSTCGQGRGSQWMIGAVADRVLHEAQVPVILIRPMSCSLISDLPLEHRISLFV